MKIKRFNCMLSLCAGVAVAMFAAPTFGQIITTTLIDDSFGDGFGGNTGTVAETAEASFFTTSSSDGLNTSIADAAGQFRFITGTSGRQIHTLFTATTLATAGDRIEVTFDFTTPDSVQSDGSGQDEELRFGLFDSTSTAGVNLFTGRNLTTTVPSNGTDTMVPIAFNTNISSSSSNEQPGLDLAGFSVDFEIEDDNTDADINFRVFDTTTPGSGRLLGTTAGSSGISSQTTPDFGLVGIDFLPNTAYTGELSIELLASGDFAVTSSVDGGGLVAADNEATGTILASNLATSTFDLLGFGASGAAFGTINTAEENPGDGFLAADNGISFTNLVVTSSIASAIPEPSSLALLGLMGCAGFIRRRR